LRCLSLAALAVSAARAGKKRIATKPAAKATQDILGIFVLRLFIE
jgi:hypothetical protein